MEDKINNAIELIKVFCRDLDKDSRLFQAGGSLLDHGTRDIDIIVQFPNITPDEVKYCEENSDYWGFSKFEYSEKYVGASGSVRFSDIVGSFDPDVKEITKLGVVTEDYDLVVKGKCLGVDFDLLMMFDDCPHPDFIKRRLSFFPLSIQQVALDLHTRELVRSIWQDSDIIWYGSISHSLEKYKSYYPDRIFKDIREIYLPKRTEIVPVDPFIRSIYSILNN